MALESSHVCMRHARMRHLTLAVACAWRDHRGPSLSMACTHGGAHSRWMAWAYPDGIDAFDRWHADFVCFPRARAAWILTRTVELGWSRPIRERQQRARPAERRSSSS